MCFLTCTLQLKFLDTISLHKLIFHDQLNMFAYMREESFKDVLQTENFTRYSVLLFFYTLNHF
jgi:hypothetical protein